MSTEGEHLEYISNILIKEIAEQLLPDKLIDFDVKHSTGLDGFMSALYTLTIKILNDNSKTEDSRQFILKFMKGDESFREASRCYIQFSNEILIYSQVIPYYSEVLAKRGVKTIKVENWVPKAYVAKYGKIDGLCKSGKTSNECVLVLENLKPNGYKPGPKLYLNKNHMLAMIKPLAEYHAMSYVLKVQKDPRLDELINAIVPLPFVEQEKTKNNFYDVLYRVAFDRFFEYFERSKALILTKDDPEDLRLENNLNKLNKKYGNNPTALLEWIRVIRDDDDRKFAAILHGDFNRNNVLFRYEDGDTDPKDAKLIDFQELRYGTPCIDLSFAMFMNMEREIRDTFWMELLQFYHSNMFNTMSSVLKADETTRASLNSYSFEEFNNHFSKYAFYGVLICMHFLPWLCCTEEDLQQLSYWFEIDLHGKEFYEISFKAGGDDANNRIFEILKHSSRMGYMDGI